MRHFTEIAILCALPALTTITMGCSSVAARPDASVEETPSHGPVGRTFAANSPKFAACGRDSVTIQTGTTQHLKLRFKVDPNGRVESAQIESMSSSDPDLYNCVLRTLKHLQFPKPKDQKEKNLTYPLTIKPE